MSFTAMITVGAATLGLCFLFFYVPMLKLCRKETVVVWTIIITVPFLCFYTWCLWVPQAFSLSHLVGAGPSALQRHYLVGSSTRPAAQCESRRAHGHHPYFLAFGGIMVVNLWSSYLSGSNVVDLLNNFFHSLGARAITILFCAEMHDSVLRLSRDALIWGRQLEGCNWLVQGHIRIHLKDRAQVHVSHESVHFLILAMVSGLMRVAARHCARPEV